MFLRFILLLIIALIVVQGEISSSTIKSNVDKLTKLYKTYTENPFATQILGTISESCPWLLECCPNDFAHFTSLMLENKFYGNCINSASGLNSSHPTCGKAPFPNPKRDESDDVDPQSKLAQHIMRWIKITESACSLDELHAFYCEKDATKKFQSCQVKTLQSVAREKGDKNYPIFVDHLEKDLTAFYGETLNKKE
jgi:hypothetical protein